MKPKRQIAYIVRTMVENKVHFACQHYVTQFQLVFCSLLYESIFVLIYLPSISQMRKGTLSAYCGALLLVGALTPLRDCLADQQAAAEYEKGIEVLEKAAVAFDESKTLLTSTVEVAARLAHEMVLFYFILFIVVDILRI